jgi:serine/threonine-protein kinase HipA
MISKKSTAAYTEAYVWVWLPGATEPVVAGLLSQQAQSLVFNYGQSYLARPDAIALYAPELPLQPGHIPLVNGLSMPSCLRDASPDAWGRRVLLHQRVTQTPAAAAPGELDELSYLLESGSDRIGALDFQQAATHYVPRLAPPATLSALLSAAECVEQGISLPPTLNLALLHGTALGGARPKVTLDDGQRKLIAKFSLSSDLYSLVKAEFIAMQLAKLAGLDVAAVELCNVMGKDVLLIERFDRVRQHEQWCRRAMVSGLTLFELDEMMAAYVSYEDLANIIRHRFTHPKATLRELFARMVFNVLCGNTDDHARNHAAFWDGQQLTLTPAYDICPQARLGQQAGQAMLIHERNRSSQIVVCVAAAATFLLSTEAAIAIVNQQIHVINTHWHSVCDSANLSIVEREFLWHRQFLNPFVFIDAPVGVMQ